MSYSKIIRCRLEVKEPLPIIRNCSGCNSKMHYYSTNCFRVNANGNKLDVWLIYQCQKCKHTYNLTIHERISPASLTSDCYQKFLSNNKELAHQYGINKNIFIKNKAEIDWAKVNYQLEREAELISDNEISKAATLIVIKNEYGLKVRTDRLMAELLNIPRSRVKQLEQEDKLIVRKTGIDLEIELKELSN